MNRDMVIGLIGVALFVIFLSIILIIATINDEECDKTFILENGAVCNNYFENDFGSSYATECSDAPVYYNPRNVKITTVCNDAKGRKNDG